MSEQSLFPLGEAVPQADSPLLDVRGLGKTFTVGGMFSAKRQVVAARDVTFELARGEAVALVGESGSGKSTIGRLLLRLETPDEGEIRLDGIDVLASEPRRASIGYRGRVQMVFQDPFGSLNPVHDVRHHLVRPLLRHGVATSADVEKRAIDLLQVVGLEPAEEFLPRHPYELSGGQRQRVAIARALAVEPDVLVADEPTSMLDVSIRMEILTLLASLKNERGLGILLITHDLASARYLADRTLVLFRGRIVESGPTERVATQPSHPYTQELIDAIAGADRLATPARGASLPADVAEESSVGCPFRHRCRDALEICQSEDPAPRVVGDVRVRCHLYPDPNQGRSAPGVSLHDQTFVS